MRMLLACLTFMASSSAAPIVTITQRGYGTAGAGPNFVDALVQIPPDVPPWRGFGSASATFQDNYVFTVTSGPENGFAVWCFDGYQDKSPFGGASIESAYGAFLGQTTLKEGHSIDGCPLTSFTRGVPIVSTLFLSASVDASSFYAADGSIVPGYAEVRIRLEGPSVLDSSMHSVTGVQYTFVEELPAPEPASVFLLACGLLLVFVVSQRAEHLHR